MQVNETGSPAGHSDNKLVAILAAATFLAVLNTTMVNVSLPTIRDEFAVSEAGAGWLVTLYSLFFGITTPFYGRLGDRYGVRRLYVAGMLIFAAGSLLASLAPTSFFPMLVGFRIVQAMGSAAIPSLGTAMITLAIPRERRGAAIGLVAMAVGAGQAVGPTLGGVLTEYISWRAVFLISASILLLVPLQMKFFSAEPQHEAKPVDWLGGIALAVTIAGSLIGLGNIQEQGLVSLPVLGSLGVALVAFGVMVLRQRTLPHPFVARELIANRKFMLSTFTVSLMMAATVSTLIIAPFLLEDGKNLGAAGVGLVLLSQAAVVILLSRTMGKLADKMDGLLIATVGVSVVLLVIVTFATVAVGWPVWAYIPLFIVFGAGQSAMTAPLQTTLTKSVPRSMAGVSFGFYYVFFFSGSALGAAMATALLSAREGTSALLPIYRGPADLSYFGDAYLFGLGAALVALVLLQFARRAGTGESGVGEG